MIREQRQVGLKTIFDLLKQKPIHLFFGIFFTIIPFLFAGMFLLILGSLNSDSPELDYDRVDENGTTIQATVDNIEVQNNISINNEHPRIISYSYKGEGTLMEGKFRALDSVKVSQLHIGDTIQIKYFNGQTIVLGVKPYAFPTDIILMILIPFLLTGLIALGLLYWRTKGQIDLFKNGNVVDAEIISMIPISGFPISGIGQKVIIHYQYQTTNGQQILGESTTTDHAILTTKKQGDKIKIFVSPDNEKKSCVISRLEEIRNNWKI